MSLLKPTTGEMVDRLVLLELKIAHCIRNGLAYDHFTDEVNDIRKALAGHVVAGIVVDELAAVHQEIWDILETDSSARLLSLNRKRYELREKIDKMTGEWKGPEKV